MWLPESGHSTKAQGRQEEHRRKLGVNQPAVVECSDGNGSTSCPTDEERELQPAQHPPIAPADTPSVSCSKPEQNRRKRKSSASHSGIDASQQYYTTSPSRGKKQPRAKSSTRCSSTVPEASRTACQAADGQEQPGAVESESDSSGKDESFMYCVSLSFIGFRSV